MYTCTLTVCDVNADRLMGPCFIISGIGLVKFCCTNRFHYFVPNIKSMDLFVFDIACPNIVLEEIINMDDFINVYWIHIKVILILLIFYLQLGCYGDECTPCPWLAAEAARERTAMGTVYKHKQVQDAEIDCADRQASYKEHRSFPEQLSICVHGTHPVLHVSDSTCMYPLYWLVYLFRLY